MSFNKKNDLKNELSKNHDIVVNFVLYLMFLVISTLRSLEWSCAFFFMYNGHVHLHECTVPHAVNMSNSTSRPLL